MRALRRAGENNDFMASGMEVVGKGTHLRFNSAHGGTEVSETKIMRMVSFLHADGRHLGGNLWITKKQG